MTVVISFIYRLLFIFQITKLGYTATSLYQSSSVKYFDSTDLINSVQNTIRKTFVPVNQRIYDPNYRFMVGISDFDNNNPKFIDIALYNQSNGSNGTTNVRIEAYANSSLVSISLQSFATISDSIAMIPLNYSDHPNFSQFWSGSGKRNITFVISYTPPNATKFISNLKSSISFNRINATFSDFFCLKSYVHNTNSTHITFSLLTDMNTKIYQLYGTILIFGSDVETRFGLEVRNLRITPSLASQNNVQLVGEKISDSTNAFYRYAQPKLSYFLTNWNMSFTARLFTKSWIGVDTDNSTIMNLYFKVTNTKLLDLGFDYLLFCANDDDCLFRSYFPQVQFIQTGSTEFRGLPMTTNSSGIRSMSFNYAFNVYFSQPPKYVMIGFYKLQMITHFRNFTLKIDSVQPQSVAFTMYFPDYSFSEAMGFTIIASDWDGVQMLYYDFTTHLQFQSVFSSTTGYRVLNYSIPYVPSSELGSRINSTILFTEISYSNNPVNVTLKSSFVSFNSTHVFLSIITEDDVLWSSLKGYVLVYAMGPSNSNLDMTRFLYSYYPQLFNRTNSRTVTFSFQPTHLYTSSPNTAGFLNQFKVTTSDKKFMMGTDITNTYSASTYKTTLSININADLGKILETGFVIVAFNQNPATSINFLEQSTTSTNNPASTQNAKLKIPNSQILDYALIIGDRISIGSNKNLKFSNDTSPHRIYDVYKFQILDDTYMQVSVKPFEVTSSTLKVTFMYMPLYQGDSWAISIYSQIFSFYSYFTPMMDWIGSMEFRSMNITQQNYSTILASKYFTVDNSVQVSCQVNITFSGLLRSLSVNSEFLLSDSSIDIDTIKTVQTFRRATIDPQKMIMITVNGNKLSVYNLSLTNCTDLEDNPITVTTTSFYSNGTSLSVSSLTYSNNTYCNPSCFSCKNFTYCYKCNTGYYQYQGDCYTSCTWPLFPVLGIYCDNTPRSEAFRNQDPYLAINNSLYLNYMLEAVSSGNNFLSIMFPTRLKYSSLPLLENDDFNFYLAESSYSLTLLSYPVNIIPYNTTFFPKLTVDLNKIGICYGFTTRASILLVNHSGIDFESDIVGYAYYSNLSNLSLATQNAYKAQFILNCSDPCMITVSLDGSIQVKHNHRTTVLSLNLTNYQDYQIRKYFYGLNFFTFEIKNTSQFDFNVQGSYQIFSVSSYIFEDSIDLPEINNCSILGCQNCLDDTVCLSCSEGYFLTLGGKSCSTECNTQLPFNIPERRCFCSNNIDCSSLQASRCDTLQGICDGCVQNSDCSLLTNGISGMMCLSGICSSCPQNCKSCNDIGCNECNQGFRLLYGDCICQLGTKLINPFQCQDVCGDGYKPLGVSSNTCDDNNTISGDGCSEKCQVESGFACKGGGPLSTDFCMKKPIMTIFQVSSSGFFIKFSQAMVLSSNLDEIFELSIENVASNEYNYSMHIISNTTVSIEIIPLSNIPKSILNIHVKDTNLAIDVYGNTLSNNFYSIELKSEIKTQNKIVYPTTVVLTQVATVMTSATSITSGAVFLTSFNPAVIWGIVNIFQLFYCLQLINVDYPDNVQDFFNVFSIGKLNMIPNPMSMIADMIDEKGVAIPKRFNDLGMSSLFLINSGPMLLLWIIAFALYAYSIVVSRHFVKIYKMIKTLAFKYRVAFEKGGILQLWIGSYFDISISLCLQLRSADMSTSMRGLSLLAALGFLCLNIFIPCREFFHPRPIDQKRKSPLYREFLEHPWFKHNYIFFILLRRFAIALTLVFLHDHPQFEIGMLLFIHTVPTLLSIFSSPYKKLHIKIIRASDDGIYFVIHFVIFLLVYNNKANLFSQDTKLNIGWFIISCSLVCVVVNLVVILHEQIKDLLRFIQLFRNKKKYGKKTTQRRAIKRRTTEIRSNTSVSESKLFIVN